jgi:tetratricopeptide (TPR) repeat protein
VSKFFGRQGELGELESMLDRVVAGKAGLVLVSGEAGIGKSRFCEEVADRAAARGVRVGWARCWESGTQPPLAPWDQLLPQIAQAAMAELPSSATGDPDLVRLRYFDQVVDRVRTASAHHPLLLVVDDLQWADVASVRLIAYLAASRPEVRAVTLATYRSGELDAGSSLAEAILTLARSGRHIPLGGLPAPDFNALVSSVRTAGGTVDIAGLHHLTAGNPLFAQELVRLLDAQGWPGTVDPDEPPPVPETVRGVLVRRLHRLSEEARAVLETAAVTGEEFGVGVLEEVTGIRPEHLLELLGEAVGAQLLSESGVATYGFAHPLVRATLYDRLGVARRVRLHERVGVALEALRERGHDVDAVSLARHFSEAAAAGSAAKAAAYCLEAARWAMSRCAYESAVGLYERALVALELDPSGADRGTVLEGLGEAQVAAGLRDGARKTYLAAAALARTRRQPRQLARAALGLGSGGGFEVALADRQQIDLLEEALVALGPEPSALRAMVTARLSVALSLSGALDRRLALSDEAVAMARVIGDAAVLAYALAAHCDAIAGPADTEPRLQESGEIIRLALSIGDRSTELLGRRLRVVALLELGDTVETDAEIEAYARLAGLIRQPLYGWYVPLWRGTRALMQGQLDRSQALADEASAVGAQAQSENATVLAEALRWYIGREAGQLDQTPALDRLLPFEPVLGSQVQASVALILADAGRHEEARARLGAAEPGIRALPKDSEWVSVMVQVAQTIAQIGPHPLAEWAYEALLPHRHRFGVEGIGAAWSGSVERPLGLLAAVLGRRREAEAHFDAAVGANRAAGSPLFVARTLRDAGVALGDRDRLAAALAAYRQLRIEGRVAELEARLGPATPSPNLFRRAGDVWTLAFSGQLVRVKDAKGLHDLAVLIARPGREVAAADLAAAPGAPRQADLGERLDEQATNAYKARLVELEAELEEADATGDPARSERAQKERDAILAQLAAAYGLGGRRRRVGGTDERARQAVSWRIRDALARIERVHPELARHLRSCVRTGSFCVYDPPDPVDWTL